MSPSPAHPYLEKDAFEMKNTSRFPVMLVVAPSALIDKFDGCENEIFRKIEMSGLEIPLSKEAFLSGRRYGNDEETEVHCEIDSWRRAVK